jgi:hypothetical protein
MSGEARYNARLEGAKLFLPVSEVANANLYLPVR